MKTALLFLLIVAMLATGVYYYTNYLAADPPAHTR